MLRSNDGFHWQPYEKVENMPIVEEAFVEITLKIDENIVGYALVEIYPTGEPKLFFKAKTLKSAIFPQVEGEYQNISKDQVEQIMERIKGEN